MKERSLRARETLALGLSLWGVLRLGGSVLAATSFYCVDAEESMATPRPARLVPSPNWRRVQLLVSVHSGVLVAVAGSPTAGQGLWWIDPRTATRARIVCTAWGGDRILSGATTPKGETFLGTSEGLFTVEESVASPFRDFAYLFILDLMTDVADQLYSPVRQIVSDGDGNLWLDVKVMGHGYVFTTRREFWRNTKTRRGKEQALPVGYPWDVPCEAMAGDPPGGRLWTYGITEDVGPNLYYIRRPQPDKLVPKTIPPVPVASAVLPRLAEPLLGVDDKGGVWLEGKTEGGTKVLHFDQKALVDVTPPSELLGKGGITCMSVLPAGGGLVVGTTTVGVLAFTNGIWSSHPVNEVLPKTLSGRLHQIEALLAPTSGELWIGSGVNLLHWQAER